MRIYPNVKIRKSVANQGSRYGVRPDLIVIHTTEGHNRKGISDLRGLANFFDTPSVKASSHVATDADGYSARMVPDGREAWSCVLFNRRSLNIEQVGFASTSRPAWLKHRAELQETARWIALWSKRHGIPIRRVKPNRSGVVSHHDLGQAGGGHFDPGPNYPWRYVLAKARLYKAAMTKRGINAR